MSPGDRFMFEDFVSLPAFPAATLPLPTEARRQHSQLPSGLRRRVWVPVARGVGAIGSVAPSITVTRRSSARPWSAIGAGADRGAKTRSRTARRIYWLVNPSGRPGSPGSRRAALADDEQSHGSAAPAGCGCTCAPSAANVADRRERSSCCTPARRSSGLSPDVLAAPWWRVC